MTESAVYSTVPGRRWGHDFMPVGLTGHLDNVGRTPVTALDRGRLNVWGNSLPADALPAGTIVVAGVPFEVPDSTADNVRCADQLISLPARSADWLHVLVTAERRCEDVVHIHYADGSVDPEWLRVSDFWPSAAHYGERLATRSKTMHYPHHVQRGLGGQIWATRIPVVRHTPVRALRLPDNIALHLFALTVEVVDGR